MTTVNNFYSVRRVSLARRIGCFLALVLPLLGTDFATAATGETIKFRRVGTQYIAALGDPNATSGTGAQEWGHWAIDPGPRGVWLKDYEHLESADGVAPAKWQFDSNDWWLEEHGLIMEKPVFPLSPGRYLVTGAQGITTMLTVHPDDDQGMRRWELDDGTLHQVTHLRCRSARYTPISEDQPCTPRLASQEGWPVAPGAEMPAVEGCKKQDYAVLFLIGVEVTK